MERIDPGWLMSTTFQIVGLAIGLAIIGLAYERSIRGNKPFVNELEHGQLLKWLAFSGIIFTIGMIFTRAAWGYKLVSTGLAALLIGLAATSSQRKIVYKDQIVRKSTRKLILRRSLPAIFLGIVVVAELSWAIHLGYHGIHLLNLARNLQDDPAQLQTDNIVALIGEASGDLGAIRQDLRPLFPIFSLLQELPFAGPYLGQVEPLAVYADTLAQAGNEISLGLEPLLKETSNDQTQLSLLERASLTLQSGQSHFASAEQAIEQTSLIRRQINPELLPTSLRQIYYKLDNNFDLITAGARLLRSAPLLSGSGQAQNYLILAQNRDELRGTGGFISGIGMLTIQDGKIQQFTLGDSYAVDDFSKAYPAPPEALKRFMLADYWVTRDANWSPDFPTSAKEAQALYSLSTGVQTQGVIAFNQLMVKRILEVVGPVQVAGTDEAVTAENVEAYMRQAWAPAPEEGLSDEWWSHRKDFMQQLGDVILEKVLNSGDQQQLVTLAMAMLDMLEKGQLLVYVNDPTAQAALNEGGLDGAVDPKSGDYLYMVDSNVGFNKVDPIIRRTLGYRVDLSDLNQPKGEATLTYQHTGSGEVACKQESSYGNGTYQDMQKRCYLDYWRLYTTAESELLASNAQPIPGSELLNGIGWSGEVESIAGEAGTQVFAGLLMLPMAQSSTITVAYSLPSRTVQTIGTNLFEYSLRIQKQPGLEGLPFQAEIKLPENVDVAAPGEGWVSISADTWSWQGVVDKSIDLKLNFSINY